jgi:hypothetical protein
MGEINAYLTPEGKIPLARSRYRWEDNIRMNLREIRWRFVDWMHLGQDRDQWRAVVNTVMNYQLLKGCAPCSLLRVIRESSISTVTAYWLNEWDSIPDRVDFFSTAFKPSLGPTQPHFDCAYESKAVRA